MFRVGQKVVCVNVTPQPGKMWFNDAPVKGSVYTIASILIIKGIDAVTLVEQKRHPLSPNGYGAFRFRPAVDRPTDISVFKSLLRERELVS